MIFTRKELAAELSNLQQLFRSKYKLSANGQCWLWVAAIRPDSYGQFHIRRKPFAAHRASYLLFVGDLVPGRLVCHTCDVPRCVNPEHLFLATCAENSADMVAKNRSSKGEAHSQAKLTEAEVLAIRATSGVSAQVAEKFGVDASLVRMIRRRAIWRHI